MDTRQAQRCDDEGKAIDVEGQLMMKGLAMVCDAGTVSGGYYYSFAIEKKKR